MRIERNTVMAGVSRGFILKLVKIKPRETPAIFPWLFLTYIPFFLPFFLLVANT